MKLKPIDEEEICFKIFYKTTERSEWWGGVSFKTKKDALKKLDSMRGSGSFFDVRLRTVITITTWS